MYISVLISSIMLLVWNIGVGGHFFAYCISGIGYAGQASNFAWANVLTREDEMLRSVTLFSMNLFSNCWALWYGIALWPVVDQPRFKKGQIATIVTGAAALVVAWAIVYCSVRWAPDLPQDQAEENAERGYKDAYEPEGGEKSHPVDHKFRVVQRTSLE